jgi:P27 family predicted phage terminase small subunit
MGVPGRKPKPTNLRVLQGNPGKRPLKTNEPKPRPVPPVMPAHLKGLAKEEWERVVPILERLGILTEVDGAALAGYCQSFARWVQCEKRLTSKGLTFTTPSGYVQQRPEVSMAQKYLQLVKSFCTEFGLTPSSRSRIELPDGDGDDDDDLD